MASSLAATITTGRWVCIFETSLRKMLAIEALIDDIGLVRDLVDDPAVQSMCDRGEEYHSSSRMNHLHVHQCLQNVEGAAGRIYGSEHCVGSFVRFAYLHVQSRFAQ
jgi:hypothetical protein